MRKTRQTLAHRHIEVSDLKPHDLITLFLGWVPAEGEQVALKSKQDVKKFYKRHKKRFHVCTDTRECPDRVRRAVFCMLPGQRPYAWWAARAYDRVPEQQPLKLSEMGEMSEEEKRAYLEHNNFYFEDKAAGWSERDHLKNPHFEDDPR